MQESLLTLRDEVTFNSTGVDLDGPVEIDQTSMSPEEIIECIRR
jgi:hypothetical protein